MEGTLLDATIIKTPSSTNNKNGERYPGVDSEVKVAVEAVSNRNTIEVSAVFHSTIHTIDIC